MEEELMKSIWKVELDEVELQKSKVAFGSRVQKLFSSFIHKIELS